MYFLIGSLGCWPVIGYAKQKLLCCPSCANCTGNKCNRMWLKKTHPMVDTRIGVCCANGQRQNKRESRWKWRRWRQAILLAWLAAGPAECRGNRGRRAKAQPGETVRTNWHICYKFESPECPVCRAENFPSPFSRWHSSATLSNPQLRKSQPTTRQRPNSWSEHLNSEMFFLFDEIAQTNIGKCKHGNGRSAQE